MSEVGRISVCQKDVAAVIAVPGKVYTSLRFGLSTLVVPLLQVDSQTPMKGPRQISEEDAASSLLGSRSYGDSLS